MQTITRDTLRTEPVQAEPAEVAIAAALNREDFKKWLVRLGNREAGRAFEPAQCPTARYLNLTTGRVVRVLNRHIACDDPFQWIPNPEWVQLFVRGVDRHSPLAPITGVECLEILDRIPA